MAQTLKEMLKDAHKMHIDATNSGNKEKLVEVLDLYNNLLNQAPEEASLIFLTGTLNMQLGHNGTAIAMIGHACTLTDEPQAEFMNNLGSAWKGEHNNEKARAYWLKALEIKEHGDYYNNLSTLYINEGNPEAGLEFSDKSVEMDPENLKAHWNRALLLLEAGRMEEGWGEYDYGLLTMDRQNRTYTEPVDDCPIWMGEDLKDKTIVVYGEQGLGDEILFASAIPDLIETGANVIYECHNRMEGLMRRSFPNITIYPTRKKNTLEWPKEHVLDYRIAVGSLFRHFRKGFDYPKVPYLKPDPKLVKKYRKMVEALGDGPYIGLGYAGGAKKTHTHKRSSQLKPLAPILDQDATFISLQYTPDAQKKFERHYEITGICVHHYPNLIESHIQVDGEREKSTGYDYDHSIALMAAMDLVIIPNTTAVHVCGAIGQKCWSLTPHAKAWRYCNGGEHMLFYGDWVKLYKGDKTGNNYAIERLSEDLKEFIG